MFGTAEIGPYAAAFLLITLPCASLLIGIGTLAGDRHPALVYAIIALLLCISCLASVRIGSGSGPWHLLDAAGESYYETMSARLETLEASETPFVISGGYVLARGLYTCLGIAAFWIGLAGNSKRTADFSR